MDDSRHSDAGLMVALQEGRTSAMEDLIERWQARLTGFVFRYIQSEAVARDIVEETFVRIYLARDRYDPRRSFTSWMFGIAANLCRNQFRWWARRRENSLDNLPEPTDPVDPAILARQREAIEELARGIRQLPHDQRVTLLLYYYEGLCYEEIARVLSCSVRGVESRLYRARKRLARKLGLHRELSSPGSTGSFLEADPLRIHPN